LLQAAAAILLFFALRELTGGGHPVAGIGDAGRDQRSQLQLLRRAFAEQLRDIEVHEIRVMKND
jgi:hypothetical protein